MFSAESGDPHGNLAGALIFTAYVASALFLTGFISTSLFHAYRSSKAPIGSLSNGKPSLDTRILPCVSLSILSFSVLSYHMLFFLIDSYTTWAQDRQIALPQNMFRSDGVLLGMIGVGQRKVMVWRWLTTSSLFQDFATDICDDWGRYWWTCQALVITMSVGLWMGRKGMRVSLFFTSSFHNHMSVFSTGCFCTSVSNQHKYGPSLVWPPATTCNNRRSSLRS